MFKTPILMLKMTFFWLLFRGKFEQKTQKSISFKNQWRLKNIKKAMVVKNIIAEDMPFTKSIFEQFWRSYCKKTIFVVFHFLKFLPFSMYPPFGACWVEEQWDLACPAWEDQGRRRGRRSWPDRPSCWCCWQWWWPCWLGLRPSRGGGRGGGGGGWASWS